MNKIDRINEIKEEIYNIQEDIMGLEVEIDGKLEELYDLQYALSLVEKWKC